MTTIDLTPRLRLAADYLHLHGWIRGIEKNSEGQVCLTGAIRYCAPQTGDEYLIREVLRKRGRAEMWNDCEATAVQVENYLRTTEVTDADLADTFGPEWETIVRLVRDITALTPEQIKRLSAAAYADAADASYAAVADAYAAYAAAAADAAYAAAAARDAAADARADAAAYAAADAAYAAYAAAAARDAAAAAADADAAYAVDAVDAAYAAVDAAYAAYAAARADAARTSAVAAAVRDLIGQHGFTQEHYDTLTGP